MKKGRLFILFLFLQSAVTICAQEPMKIVGDFYDNWSALSKLSRFDDANALNLECILNSYAEGGDDCENKSLISLPREFLTENEKSGGTKPGVNLGPYISFFETFIRENSAKLSFESPKPIASIKRIGSADDSKPAYYCFVVSKTYTWGGGKSRMLNDTIWVKSACNKISGIRNEFGGSRQVSYNDTISTATLSSYSASELEISAMNLYYSGKYKEAFKILKELSLRNYRNLSSQTSLAYMLSENKRYNMSNEFGENLMFWLAAKNLDAKDSNLHTTAHLAMYKYIDNKKHKAAYSPDLSYIPLSVDFPYGKEMQKLNDLIFYEKPLSRGLMLAMNNSDKHQMGYMNEGGKMVIPYKYKQAHSFSNEGLALVTEDNIKWKFIDERGNDAMPLTFDCAIHNFSNGLTFVTKSKVAMIINTKGEIIKKIDGYNTVFPFLSMKNYAMLFKDRSMKQPFDVYDFNGNMVMEGCDGFYVDRETGDVKVLRDKKVVLTDDINW